MYTEISHFLLLHAISQEILRFLAHKFAPRAALARRSEFYEALRGLPADRRPPVLGRGDVRAPRATTLPYYNEEEPPGLGTPRGAQPELERDPGGPDTLWAPGLAASLGKGLRPAVWPSTPGGSSHSHMGGYACSVYWRKSYPSGRPPETMLGRGGTPPTGPPGAPTGVPTLAQGLDIGRLGILRAHNEARLAASRRRRSLLGERSGPEALCTTPKPGVHVCPQVCFLRGRGLARLRGSPGPGRSRRFLCASKNTKNGPLVKDALILRPAVSKDPAGAFGPTVAVRYQENVSTLSTVSTLWTLSSAPVGAGALFSSVEPWSKNGGASVASPGLRRAKVRQERSGFRTLNNFFCTAPPPPVGGGSFVARKLRFLRGSLASLTPVGAKRRRKLISRCGLRFQTGGLILRPFVSARSARAKPVSRVRDRPPSSALGTPRLASSVGPHGESGSASAPSAPIGPFWVRAVLGRRNPPRAPLTRLGVCFFSIFFLILTSCFFGTISNYVCSDFSIYNILTNSTADVPLFYKISATWSNHEGSLLLWCWLLSFNTFLFCISICTTQFVRFSSSGASLLFVAIDQSVVTSANRQMYKAAGRLTRLNPLRSV